MKLCKIKYYNYAPVYSVQRDFSFQTGDPIGPDSKDSDGGSSIWGLLDPANPSKKTFLPEFHPKLKHVERGTVSMATVPSPTDPDARLAGSQFIVTLGENLEYLDGKAAVFGTVVEGFDALEKINTAFIDDNGRPLKDIRIRHTIVLDDPFPDHSGLVEPPESPVPTQAQLATVRIRDDEELDENMDQEQVERLRREREARAQALTLEMMGDLPFAEVKPPENVLFICKLNPVTQDDDLDLIFSRFGKILSCEVIRDRQTGDSLQYAFIEFDDKKSCEQAYFKMQDVLIDDHRIHVDFSQSVSKLSNVWRDATNSKRERAHGGGFGGISSLEKKRHYRAEYYDGGDRGSKKYGLVFDKDERRRQRDKSRSRSPRGDRDSRRSGFRDSDRPRGRDDSGDRKRDRSRDRFRDDRRREGSAGRYRRDDRGRDYEGRR